MTGHPAYADKSVSVASAPVAPPTHARNCLCKQISLSCFGPCCTAHARTHLLMQTNQSQLLQPLLHHQPTHAPAYANKSVSVASAPVAPPTHARTCLCKQISPSCFGPCCTTTNPRTHLLCVRLHEGGSPLLCWVHAVKVHSRLYGKHVVVLDGGVRTALVGVSWAPESGTTYVDGDEVLGQLDGEDLQKRRSERIHALKNESQSF